MMKEMWVAGVTVDPTTKSPIVILRDKEGRQALPIWIGALEANSIVVFLRRMEIARPMTHDLMLALLNSTDTNLYQIEIADIKDKTYYALLHLERGNERFALDSRPSDAIAMALRCRAPIMVSTEVLEHALPIEILETAPENKDSMDSKDEQTEPLDKMDPEHFSKYKM